MLIIKIAGAPTPIEEKKSKEKKEEKKAKEKKSRIRRQQVCFWDFVEINFDGMIGLCKRQNPRHV